MAIPSVANMDIFSVGEHAGVNGGGMGDEMSPVCR
jgi:hypothetical protein